MKKAGRENRKSPGQNRRTDNILPGNISTSIQAIEHPGYSEIKPYLLVNLVLAGLCGLVFLYSGIYPAERDRYPVPSFFQEITGQPAPSSGMSRAFSEIIRGNTVSAREYNPDSPRIFAFFLVQGIQRLAVSLLLIRIGKTPCNHEPRRTREQEGRRVLPQKSKQNLMILITADIAASLVLFVYCFLGQIRAMIGLMMS